MIFMSSLFLRCKSSILALENSLSESANIAEIDKISKVSLLRIK